MKLLAIIPVFLVACGACKTSPPPPQERLPMTVSIDPWVYPNGSTLRVQLEAVNATGEVRVVLGDGGVAAPSTRGPDGGLVVELPSGIAEGLSTLMAVDEGGATATTPASLAAGGIFLWSISEHEPGFGQCVGPYWTDGGVAVAVCPGGGNPFAPQPDFGLDGVFFSPHATSKTAVTYATVNVDSGVVMYTAAAQDTHGGPEPLAIVARVLPPPALLYAGTPSTWTPDHLVLRSIPGLPYDACATVFWHGPMGTYLLVGGHGGFVSIPWPVPLGQAAVATDVPPLEGGARFCGLSAEDMDGDGQDELVTAFYPDRVGISLYAGDPITGFHRLLQTHDVELDPVGGGALPQYKASFEDLDGDGLKDMVATNHNGGVDAVFMNHDGTAELHRELIPVHEFIAAATAVRLGPDRLPYVLVPSESGRSAFRVIDRSTVVDESWRISGRATQAYNRPLLVFDVDGDGLPDLVGNDGPFYVSLWRRPVEDERNGLFGPRKVEFETTP